MTPTLLDDSQIEDTLATLDIAWSAIPGQGLVRVFAMGSFAEGVALITKLAQVAEQLNHHPDVHLSSREVEVTLSTHSVGGVTERDVEFARAVDDMLP